MIKIENEHLRFNRDGSTKELIGWYEFVLNANGYKFYFNNVRVLPKEIGDKVRVRQEYPSKIITQANGVEKKIFFCKPVNAEAYGLVEVSIHNYLQGLKNANT